MTKDYTFLTDPLMYLHVKLTNTTTRNELIHKFLNSKHEYLNWKKELYYKKFSDSKKMLDTLNRDIENYKNMSGANLTTHDIKDAFPEKKNNRRCLSINVQVIY